MSSKLLVTGIALACIVSCSRDSSKAPHREQIVNMKVADPQAPPADAPDADSRTSMNEVADETKSGDKNQDNWKATTTSAGYTPVVSANATSAPSAGEAISSSAARVNGTDTLHRFIRTADLRFRVKDVVRATLGIEDIVGQHNGWVVNTALNNPRTDLVIIPVSEDSSLEVSRYEMTNEITLRVPNTDYLDSTLRQIGRWVDLFDHRTISAMDIKLDMMRNAMATRRAQAHARRLSNDIDEQGKKLRDSESAEESLENTEARADDARLSNLELADRVAFSTVKLSLYPRETFHREMIANVRNIEGYQPSLFSQIKDALRGGWRILENTVLGLLSIWPFVVVVVLLVMGWRRMRRGRKGA